MMFENEEPSKKHKIRDEAKEEEQVFEVVQHDHDDHSNEMTSGDKLRGNNIIHTTRNITDEELPHKTSNK